MAGSVDHRVRKRRLRQSNAVANRLSDDDRPVHDWYRFVLSFPPHLVRDYVARLGLTGAHTVLDPFCGTGTTLVECKKLGIPSVGTEAHPMPHFASSVKVDWGVDPEAFERHATDVAQRVEARLRRGGVPDETFPLRHGHTRPRADLRELPPQQAALLLKGCISPRPLHKALLLLEELRKESAAPCTRHEWLALATTLVRNSSNLQFGPEVGVGAAKPDAPVVWPWLNQVRQMCGDIRLLQAGADTPSVAHRADARDAAKVLAPRSIDAVITSPPYPNEKDYTRTTRLESVLLGFVRTRAELRPLKQGMLRSNTRGVYRGDRDDELVADHPEIQRLGRQIEARRKRMGKTSGFERQYARVTKLYFGGMLRHLASLRAVLRPGARLAYVVGDQASFLRVMIRTGKLLAGIAESLAYDIEGIELFRTRLATATREQLREEVVVMRWSGGKEDS